MSYSHVFGTKIVKIRKNRHCLGCGDKYPKGSKLHVTSGVMPGEGFWTSYWCDICWAFQQTPKFHWDNYDDGDGGIHEDCFKDSQRYEDYRRKYIEELQYVNT